MGDLNRFQRRILPHTDPEPIKEVYAFSYTGQNIPIQGTTIRPLHNSHGVHCSGQRSQVSYIAKGYKDPPDWLVRARSHQICLQHTRTLTSLCQELGWLVNRDKSELEPKQVFDFVGYQFDLREGKVRPSLEYWQTLQTKIRDLLTGPVCAVWKLMSLIGLPTATEKQVHLDRLHMRPIQWHLKNNWRIPEYLDKQLPVPKSLHPHLKWWLEEDNVLQGQPLHPLKHALQIFTDTSKEGGGALT